MDWTYVKKLLKEAPSLFLAQINADFARDLYPAILQVTQDRDVAISPFFLQSFIVLTYLGSAGETAIELARALKLPGEASLNIKKPFQQVLQKYASCPYLEIASKICVGPNVKLKSAFNKVVTKHFLSEVEVFDFTDPYRAAKALNEWISQKTKSTIPSVVDWISINPLTNMMLVNAISFNGLWEKGFNEEDTEERDFWISDLECVKVPTMFQKGFFKFGFIRRLGASILEMKYSNTDIWMLIILPIEKTGLDLLEDRLTNKDLHRISRELRTKFVNVFLPKFRIECQLDLKLALTGLGMGSIFLNPDFSNMFEENPVKVDKIIHKVVLDVNEKGTHIIYGISSDETKEDFNANRPFFFAIKSDSAILFTGRYVNSPSVRFRNNASMLSQQN